MNENDKIKSSLPQQFNEQSIDEELIEKHDIIPNYLNN